MIGRYMRYRTKEGCRQAIVFEGRTKLHVVTICPDLQSHTVAMKETRHMTEVASTTVKKAVKQFRKIGNRHGMSQRVKKLFRQLEVAA